MHRESLFARVYVNGNAPRSPRKCSMISLYRKSCVSVIGVLSLFQRQPNKCFHRFYSFFFRYVLNLRYRYQHWMIDNLSIELLSMTSHPPVIQYSVCMACSLPSLTLDHEVRCTFINSKSALIYPTFVSRR